MGTEWVSNQTAQCLYNVACYELATLHLSVWSPFIFSFILKTCFDLLPLSCKTNTVKVLGAWLWRASLTTCAAGSAWSHPWAGSAWTGSPNPRAGSLRVLSSLHLQKCRSVAPSATQTTQRLHAAPEGCSSSGQLMTGLSALCSIPQSITCAFSPQ